MAKSKSEIKPKSKPAKAAKNDTGSANTAEPAEVLFYHLEHFPLERVLPTLVEKTLQRGWRAVIQAGSVERVEALDGLLWTYRDDSFIPHGTARDGAANNHPVYLTQGEEAPNDAQLRFLVDGADIDAGALNDYSRVVYLFDGHDPEAVAAARGQWKRAKKVGCSLAYWQQSSDGRWQKKAEG